MGLLLAVFVCGFGFYDNRDNRNNGLIENSMLSVLLFKKNYCCPLNMKSQFEPIVVQ